MEIAESSYGEAEPLQSQNVHKSNARINTDGEPGSEDDETEPPAPPRGAAATLHLSEQAASSRAYVVSLEVIYLTSNFKCPLALAYTLQDSRRL